MKAKIGIRNFLIYFKNTTFASINANTLGVYIESQQQGKACINFISALQEIAKETWQSNTIGVQLVLPNGSFFTDSPDIEDGSVTYFNDQKEVFTFDTLAEGNENIEAISAAKSIACFDSNNIINSGSATFIHGIEGTGKTHVVKAIENYYKGEGGSVLYINANSFLKQYVNSARNGSTFTFQDGVLNHDIIIIEDIHNILSKPGTMLAIENLATQIAELGKYLVLTSRQTPIESSSTNINIKNILSNAICISMQPSGKELKRKILINYIIRSNFNIPISVAEGIIDVADINIKELKSLIKKLSIVQSVRKIELNFNLAMEILSDQLQSANEHKANVLQVGDIISSVAIFYQLDQSALFSKIKTANVCNARNVAMYLLFHMKSMCYQEIARLFQKNHSTVIAGIKSVSDKLKTDSKLPSQMADIAKEIAKLRL